MYKSGLRTPVAIAEASIPEIAKALFESSTWSGQGILSFKHSCFDIFLVSCYSFSCTCFLWIQVSGGGSNKYRNSIISVTDAHISFHLLLDMFIMKLQILLVCL